jgi:hypothetical protein
MTETRKRRPRKRNIFRTKERMDPPVEAEAVQFPWKAELCARDGTHKKAPRANAGRR